MLLVGVTIHMYNTLGIVFCLFVHRLEKSPAVLAVRIPL